MGERQFPPIFYANQAFFNRVCKGLQFPRWNIWTV